MDAIILQMGEKAGLQVSDQQLDQAIQNIAAQNRMSVDQLRSRLAYDGMNYNDYRAQIRKEMLISKCVTMKCAVVSPFCRRKWIRWLSRLARRIPGTELNISQILLPLPENPTQQQVDDRKRWRVSWWVN